MRVAKLCILYPAAFLSVLCYASPLELIPSDAANISPEEARPFLNAICLGKAVAMGCWDGRDLLVCQASDMHQGVAMPEPGNPPTEYGFAVAPATAYLPAK